MAETWNNWSGSVSCTPRSIHRPRHEGEAADLVRDVAARNGRLRVAGSGHSFTPLCASDDTLVSLDEMQGVVDVDVERQQATVRAGTKIYELGEPLAGHGLALANQGDIDRQALAGAIATGTHGTGPTLGSLSTQVVGLRLVDGRGELREIDARQGELLAAARVSLGALGLITAIRLQLVPAYRLHERLWQVPIEACLAELPAHIAATRHFEFFWYPATDLAHMKALDPTDASPSSLDDRSGERIDHSYRIFPSERNVRFNEIEFALPAAAGPACFRAVRGLMRDRFVDVTWPVEYRTLASDDILLSPAQGRETVTISVHQAAELSFREFFREVEAIFLDHEGRPHWGKIHMLTAERLRQLYPGWKRFQAARRELDPAGVFSNAHLAQLWGES